MDDFCGAQRKGPSGRKQSNVCRVKQGWRRTRQKNVKAWFQNRSKPRGYTWEEGTRFYTVLFVISLLLSHCSKQFNTLFAMHARSSNAPRFSKGRSARLKRGWRPRKIRNFTGALWDRYTYHMAVPPWALIVTSLFYVLPEEWKLTTSCTARCVEFVIPVSLAILFLDTLFYNSNNHSCQNIHKAMINENVVICSYFTLFPYSPAPISNRIVLMHPHFDVNAAPNLHNRAHDIYQLLVLTA